MRTWRCMGDEEVISSTLESRSAPSGCMRSKHWRGLGPSPCRSTVCTECGEGHHADKRRRTIEIRRMYEIWEEPARMIYRKRQRVGINVLDQVRLQYGDKSTKIFVWVNTIIWTRAGCQWTRELKQKDGGLFILEDHEYIFSDREKVRPRLRSYVTLNS